MARKSAAATPGNGEQLAKLLNLSIPQCYNLANSGTIPKPDNGVWDITSCAHQYIKYLQGRAGEEKRAYTIERTRLIKLQADKTELEIETLKGQLYPASVVETVWNGMVMAFRARMLSLPAKAAPLCTDTSISLIEDHLRDCIYEALTELADYDPDRYIAAYPTNQPATSTPAEIEGEPVGEPGAPPIQRKRRRAGPVSQSARAVPGGDDGCDS